jgi:hypothetical protein
MEDKTSTANILRGKTGFLWKTPPIIRDGLISVLRMHPRDRLYFKVVCFHPCLDQLGAMDHRGNLYIFKMNHNQFSLLHRCGGEGTVLAFSPTRPLLAAGFMDGTVRLYDVNTGQLVMMQRSHAGPVREIGFSHTGLHAFSSCAYSIIVWETGPSPSLKGPNKGSKSSKSTEEGSAWIGFRRLETSPDSALYPAHPHQSLFNDERQVCSTPEGSLLFTSRADLANSHNSASTDAMGAVVDVWSLPGLEPSPGPAGEGRDDPTKGGGLDLPDQAFAQLCDPAASPSRQRKDLSALRDNLRFSHLAASSCGTLLCACAPLSAALWQTLSLSQATPCRPFANLFFLWDVPQRCFLQSFALQARETTSLAPPPDHASASASSAADPADLPRAVSDAFDSALLGLAFVPLSLVLVCDVCDVCDVSGRRRGMHARLAVPACVLRCALATHNFTRFSPSHPT